MELFGFAAEEFEGFSWELVVPAEELEGCSLVQEWEFVERYSTQECVGASLGILGSMRDGSLCSWGILPLSPCLP